MRVILPVDRGGYAPHKVVRKVKNEKKTPSLSLHLVWCLFLFFFFVQRPPTAGKKCTAENLYIFFFLTKHLENQSECEKKSRNVKLMTRINVTFNWATCRAIGAAV